MKLTPLIKRTVLIAIALVLEAIDKHITESLEKPTRQPLTPNPSKCTYKSKEDLQQPIRPYIVSINPSTGIITSTTANSKYTKEQLQDFYKINPYTNKPTNPPKKR